jgi:hypothetical protein
MDDTDFDLLRRRIKDACGQTFEAVRAARPGERFYAFALYTVDDAVGVVPSMNSEEAYQRAVAKELEDLQNRKWLDSHGIDFEASILGDQRWSPYDWAYDGEEADGFIAVNQLINKGGVGAYDESDAEGFAKFKAGVLASMVLGLADAVTAGHFGSGLEGDSLTVFCSVAQSEEAIWFEDDSARRLNSPAVYRTFAEQHGINCASALPLGRHSVHMLWRGEDA